MSASDSPAQPDWNQWSEGAPPGGGSLHASQGTIRPSDGRTGSSTSTDFPSKCASPKSQAVYRCGVLVFSLLMPESVQECHIPALLGQPHVTVPTVLTPRIPNMAVLNESGRRECWAFESKSHLLPIITGPQGLHHYMRYLKILEGNVQFPVQFVECHKQRSRTPVINNEAAFITF